MIDFNKKLKAINEAIETLELEILKLEFDLKYMKEVLKKKNIKKRTLLSSYRY
tara:strand:- start:4076 stop:4234 length:159 start_codon:yes stop_codon:yes gene_type:complete